MTPIIKIKGISEGLLVTIHEDDDSLESGLDETTRKEQIYNTLLAQLDEKADFFKGARLALDVGAVTLRAAELGRLRDRISERGIVLWAVLSRSAVTEQNAQTLGLATRIRTASPERTIRAIGQLNGPVAQQGESAIVLRRTLRSGFKFQFAGHVIVIGDVNPGAEIIASGDIIVWGRLRGVVHAGAEGDENAVVCALSLAPTQLRIASQIAVSPRRRGGQWWQRKTQQNAAPEIARLKDGQVVAEPWEESAAPY